MFWTKFKHFCFLKLSKQECTQTIESTPPNFVFHHKPRVNSKNGGGVGILLRKDLLPIVVDTTHISCTSFEHLAVSIKANDKDTTLICIYRPPQQRPLTVFFDELETLILQIQGKTPNIVLAGDFNIPVNNPSSSSTEFIARLNDIRYIDRY